MKHKYILAAVLFCAGTSVFAQKLSPSTETLLIEHSQRTSKGEVATDETVHAYVKITDSAVLQEIEKLGGKIHSQAAAGYVTATLPVSALRAVASLDEVEYVRAGNRIELLMDDARSDASVDKAQEGTTELGAHTGQGVVVGVVDNGFEYGHAAFYNADGTALRIKRIWDQNSLVGRSPEGFDYGTEYTNTSEMLAAASDMGATFHGSHVAGIATGGDRQSAFYGVAPDADIVLVSFKNSDPCIVDGVRYVFNYASSVGKPCVVNISLGSHKGPHDGTSVTDRTFDELTGPGRIIVGAAGNEGSYKMHASKKLTAEDNQLKTMIGYTNESAARKYSALDIWGSPNTQMNVKVVVVNTMTGRIAYETESVDCSNPESKKIQLPADSKVTGTITLASIIDPDNHRPNVEVTTQASYFALNRKLGVVVTGDAGSEIHIWNNQYGDLQSNNKAGWTAGNTDCTVGEIGGTGKNVISVGSYTTKTRYSTVGGDVYDLAASVGPLHDISIFSSLGPATDGRMKPDVVAPGAGIVSACSQYYYGFIASTTAAYTQLNGNSYYYDINAGTSMASPFVAGAVALWLQANPELTPEGVRQIIQNTARHDEFTGATTESNTWGYGKIDVYAGLLQAHKTAAIGDVEAQSQLIRVTCNRTERTLRVECAAQGEGIQTALYDATGRTVLRQALPAQGGTINVASLPSGVYVVKVQAATAAHTLKVAL